MAKLQKYKNQNIQFYTQNYFKKFIDFGAYKGYQQLISEFENSEIMLEDMNLTGFHKFTNDFINQHLIKEFSLHQHLHMIKKLYFGFQSDFISQFSALNQGQTQISSKTQCENDLDYLLKQSCFNYDKNILNKIGVEVFKKEFLITFNPQELSCVISEETALNFQKVFKLIVNLRKLELHLLTEKKIYLLLFFHSLMFQVFNLYSTVILKYFNITFYNIQNDSLNCNLIISTKAQFNHSIFISQTKLSYTQRYHTNQSQHHTSSSRIVTLNSLLRQPKLVQHLNQHC
ncbi:Spindle_pole body component [Hexamita inflata]|uniref:Spindle pole body component n=1 Tax=Hexamita inflata TaxID=28002 RepID=A0AA86RVW2_9EUKA|nr:Spindle pole body component [Hexamita inflata]